LLEFISRQTYCQLWWLIQKSFMHFSAHLFYIVTWILIIFLGKQEGTEESPTHSIFCLYNKIKKSYVHADLGQQKEKDKKTVQKDKTELQNSGNPISKKRFLSGLGLYNIQLHFIAKRLQHPRERCSPSKSISYLWVYIVQSVIIIISLKIGHCILDRHDSILSSTVASESHLMPTKHQAPKGHLKNKFSSVSSTLCVHKT